MMKLMMAVAVAFSFLATAPSIQNDPDSIGPVLLARLMAMFGG